MLRTSGNDVSRKKEPSHFFVRRAPPQASFIWKRMVGGGASARPQSHPPPESKRRTGYASAPRCPEPCDVDHLRHRHSTSRVLRGIPGNHGTTDGLHTRCFPVLRRAYPGHQPDRCVLAAKYPAALRSMPFGVRVKRQRVPTTPAETSRRSAEVLQRPISRFQARQPGRVAVQLRNCNLTTTRACLADHLPASRKSTA